MTAVLFAYSAWLHDSTTTGMVWGTFAVVVCWPFTGLMYIPMGLHSLYKDGMLPALTVAVLGIAVFLGVSALVDTHLYGKPTVAIYNLVFTIWCFNLYTDT